MHSPGTSSRTTGPWNISDVALRFGSTRPASAMIRGALTLAVLAALLLIAASQAQAQTETVLYNFTGGSDGSSPQSNLIFDRAGNLYGTTEYGGLGFGTVFELSPNGSGGWNETVLYSFTGGTDGANPTSDLIFDSVGNLYGTAYVGGAIGCGIGYGCGVVFELSPAGGSWTETVLYTFCSQSGCADGGFPATGVIMDPAGNLYGANSAGFFELSPSGGGWTEQVIYGASDATGVTMDAAGNIFGGGSFSVFELSPNGSGGWNPTVIYSFPFCRSCRIPHGTPVLDQAGNLYGTLIGLGRNNGAVYKMRRGKKGWTKEILYSFRGPLGRGPKDGSQPWAGIVFDTAGNIYGTTFYGGFSRDGTVYELVAPVGEGRYKEKVLWSFHIPDGALPRGSLILDSAGNLYGTTITGGTVAGGTGCGGGYGCGVVFEVTGLPAATTTTLTSSPNPSTYDQAVTFTAVVTSSAGAPPDGETVTFEQGRTVLGTGALSGGSAIFATSTLKVGTTKVTALYTGDSNFSGSTSNVVKQVVKKAPK